MALRRRGLARSIVGIGRDAARLTLAVEKGAIDSYALDLGKGCADADAIVLCGPVSVILDQIPTVMAAAPSGALVTDVGSTKRSIVQCASRQPRDDVSFVGSHPVAGSEKSGAAHARADLFEGATVVLTPALSTSDEALERTRQLWKSVGMRIVEILPSRHDEILAMVSHLPHLVACALVAQAGQGAQSQNADALKAIAGPGFADTTRVAMGSVPMWLDILTDNDGPVIGSLDRMLDILYETRRAILQRDRDSLQEFLRNAADLRKEFDLRKEE